MLCKGWCLVHDCCQESVSDLRLLTANKKVRNRCLHGLACAHDIQSLRISLHTSVLHMYHDFEPLWRRSSCMNSSMPEVFQTQLLIVPFPYVMRAFSRTLSVQELQNTTPDRVSTEGTGVGENCVLLNLRHRFRHRLPPRTAWMLSRKLARISRRFLQLLLLLSQTFRATKATRQSMPILEKVSLSA